MSKELKKESVTEIARKIYDCSFYDIDNDKKKIVLDIQSKQIEAIDKLNKKKNGIR